MLSSSARAACAGAVLAALAAGCSDAPRSAMPSAPLPPAGEQLFTRLPAAATGIPFTNALTATADFNVFTYRNFYNGGGVAAGDLTGDGLPEIVLTANQAGPRLYLNHGGFRFTDVTRASGIRFKGAGAWATGVTMADVNGDGRLDVYICYAGSGLPAQRANELWLNDGMGKDSVPRFHEAAAQFGIADAGYSTQAVFFDYDRDGQLDLFVLNNSPRPVTALARAADRTTRDQYGGDKLYHRVGDRFVDVTARAGIHESEIGLGLGVGVSDLNGDGWPDIYVANDFFEHDYLYLNQHDGTFADSIARAMPVMSNASMGMDIADVNNDGLPDVYTTDMLPEDPVRLKRTTAYETWPSHQAHVRQGYLHQFTRNMLQLNDGDGTWSDVGQMAGVARTDWSWGALIADFDLDGNKDIFVTNGIAKDVTSQDYLEYLFTQGTPEQLARGRKVDFLRLIDAAPSTKVPNVAFRSNGDLTFANASAAWGLDTPDFSSGAAYADLDGDGALDLVVNNVDDTAFVYRNNARALTKNRFLQLRLVGTAPNDFAVGARARVFAGADVLLLDEEPTRGFQSSVEPLLTFGVGVRDTVDSVRVTWPSGRETRLRAVATNQRLVLRESAASAARGGDTSAVADARPAVLLRDVSDSVRLPFAHHENAFSDFDHQPLMPRLLSTEGPPLAVADVNGDGLDDLYLGGARGQPGVLLVQQANGAFVATSTAEFAKDSISEDVGAVFFDANGDGRPDLYVVSGGGEFGEGAPMLQDRLYLNRGGGAFVKADGAVPREVNPGSHVVAADYDGDHDVDLFVGGRIAPWRYGVSGTSMLLQNDGRGHFRDVTEQLAPALRRAGMVTDAVWRDVDGDGRVDLVVVGEWMPVTVFHNAGGGRLVPQPVRGLEHSSGWWNRIVAADVDGDGRMDFVLGNVGLNTRLRASVAAPLTMLVGDFAHDGFAEQIICEPWKGTSYPLAIRDELVEAIPEWKSRFLTFERYATQTCAGLLPPADSSRAVVRSAELLASVVAHNNGDGSFTLQPLPPLAQIAPLYGIAVADVNGDGRPDLLLGGNFDGVQPEIGRMYAGEGLVLLGDGGAGGGFRAVSPRESGFVVPGETRGIARVHTAQGDVYVVARNDDRPLVFRAAGGRTKPDTR